MTGQQRRHTVSRRSRHRRSAGRPRWKCRDCRAAASGRDFADASGRARSSASAVSPAKATASCSLRCSAPSRRAAERSIDGRPNAHPQPARRDPRGIGIALVPEDRKTEGLLLGYVASRDNLTLADPGAPVSRSACMRRAAERRWRAEWSSAGDRTPASSSRSARCPAATSRRCCSAAGCWPIRASCCFTTSRAASMSPPSTRSTNS